MKKKVCFSTGKRGGFGAITPLLKKLSQDPKIDLQLICTDMHLTKNFGKTVNEVSKYFDVTATVKMKQKGDTPSNRLQALGNCIVGMSKELTKLNPDILLLLGDRSETLATAFSAVQLGIPVAHIQGGDVSGGLDDLNRHSISKLSHIHFAQTYLQGKRLLALGEERKRVKVVGSPYVDRIVKKKFSYDLEYLIKKYKFDFNKDYFLVLNHPDTYRHHESEKQMDSIFEALKIFKQEVIVIYPCSDQGYEGVIKSIEKNQKKSKKIHVYRSIDSFDFLGILNYCQTFIGNSSSGIIEAPYFYKPFVNLGERQNNREKDINVINAEYNSNDIVKKIKLSVNKKFRKKLSKSNRVFGDGDSCDKIYTYLSKLKIDKKFFQKKVVFNNVKFS